MDLVKSDPTNARRRESWMPDPGVYNYVVDVLEELGIEVEHLPDHWVPLGIRGTLDWVILSGWWIFLETGVYDTKEQLRWIHEYHRTELTPDRFAVYRNDDDRRKGLWKRRLESPGLENEEKSEALGFVTNDVYEMRAPEVLRMKGRSKIEREELVPPQVFIEAIMHGTFLWILSDYGSEWVRNLDPLLSYIYEHGVSYLHWYESEGIYSEEEESEVLDPALVRRTNRQPGTCSECNSKLWCVRGLDIADHWVFICHACARKFASMPTSERPDMDLTDPMLTKPSCPQFYGKCSNLGCPHNQAKEDPRVSEMKRKGRQRQDAYRKKMLESKNSRGLTDQSLEDVIRSFHG